MKRKNIYGWRRDLPDHRDIKYCIEKVSNNLSTLIDLRNQMPPIVDQGELGSCTANAIAGALGFNLIKQKLQFTPLSRLFIYYNERVIEGTVKSDSGAEIRDGIKSVASQGVCTEVELPYDITKFTKKPSKTCYKRALADLALQYLSIDNNNLLLIKTCLASGYPIVYGFTVYESFESEIVAKTGIVPLPSKSESVLGGHAVVCVGYDDSKQAFICRNSWGTTWGLEGYFYIPYTYLTNINLASDFWCIKQIK